MQAPAMADHSLDKPDTRVSVKEVFNFDSALQVPAFGERSEMVPDVDPGYHFNPEAGDSRRLYPHSTGTPAGIARHRKIDPY